MDVIVVIFVLCYRKDPESKFEKKLTDKQLAKISTRKDPVTQ